MTNYIRTKRDRFFAVITYPKIYSLYNTSMQLFWLRDCWQKRLLQWLLLSFAPEHNYVIRLLLNDKRVTKQQVESFKAISGGWWTGDKRREMCDREYRLLNEQEAEFNYVDGDMLNYLWNYRNNG